MSWRFRYQHPSLWGFQAKRALDYGCGNLPRNPFMAQELYFADVLDLDELEFESDKERFGDPISSVRYRKITRFEPMPFENNFFNVVTAFDVLEHLSREPRVGANEFISVLNDIHRVLAPGGIFLALTPAFPSSAAFQDPTHVNIITTFTSHYFIGQHAPAKLMGYGLNAHFDLVSQFWNMPFSQITSEYPENLTYRGLKTLTSIPKLRRFISGLRKPTHFVWIFRKPH
jgi:SAM-dependent methyltransferase